MSIGSVLSGTVRAVVVAAATGAAAFGLLVVFHPFGSSTPEVAVSTTAPGGDALRARIDSAREALRQTETALADVTGTSISVSTSPSDTIRAQYDAQIGAATERRDLALRHAKAIRDGLAAGIDVSLLAEIRDSVVVGQLLSQRSALDARIAEEGARFKANHPTMRALTAQRNALNIQIKAEAASIAAALEAEAKLDDAQIALLQSQLNGTQSKTVPATGKAADTAKLMAQASAQRAELDGLMESYFALKPGTTTTTTTSAASTVGLLSPLNLFVAGVAALAALVFQFWLGLRRVRLQREARDLQSWRDDDDPEVARHAVPMGAGAQAQPLRRAS